MVLKKRTKKLLIIALGATTMVWFVALYLHIQGYNRYLQDEYASYIERFGEGGGQWLWDSSQEVPTILRFFRFLGYAWPNGLILIQSALIIFVAWIFVIRAHGKKEKMEKLFAFSE
jgi:hypothetical protein